MAEQVKQSWSKVSYWQPVLTALAGEHISILPGPEFVKNKNINNLPVIAWVMCELIPPPESQVWFESWRTTRHSVIAWVSCVCAIQDHTSKRTQGEEHTTIYSMYININCKHQGCMDKISSALNFFSVLTKSHVVPDSLPWTFFCQQIKIAIIVFMKRQSDWTICNF